MSREAAYNLTMNNAGPVYAAYTVVRTAASGPLGEKTADRCNSNGMVA